MSKKNRKQPKDERAPNTSKNGKIAESLEQIKKQQANKVALRIDNKTVIEVSPENQTEEYRQKWIERYNESTKRMNY